MSWTLHNQQGEFIKPLTYTNGKTQEDVVQEVLTHIHKGKKIILIKGQCGSGKSALALHIAKELGSASIVVPVKYLQKQYEEDYTNKFQIFKEKKEQLKIISITGRNNHHCLYNINSNADDRFLPCHIEIKRENEQLLRAYIKNNPVITEDEVKTFEDIRRAAVAGACPYWSPILPKEWSAEGLEDAKAYEYEAVNGKKIVYYEREKGCTYYNQYKGYLSADAIIFNSKKYELENVMNRKPSTAVEIIDECDEFLDKLSHERKLNLDMFTKRLDEIREFCQDKEMKAILTELYDLTLDIRNARWMQEFIDQEEIVKLEETKIIEIVKLLIANDQLLEFEDLEHYYELAKSFEGFFESTYVSFEESKKNQIIVNLVNVNLEKKLNEILEKNKSFVLMSGTLHSKKVLEEIFGIKEFVVVEAETANNGKVLKMKTGLEKNFRYKEFAEGIVTREQYLRALDACIQGAQSPILVHVNSFADLPSAIEKDKFGLTVMSQETLLTQQDKYKKGELMQWFKEGKLKILYSTKCNRGVDFPGEMCNSIIFTKFPYPSMSSLFWKVLKQIKPKEFMDFYFDKANREFLQRIYRGLRSKEDQVYLLSPDSKVLQSVVN